MIEPEQFCTEFGREHRLLSKMLERREQSASEIVETITADQLLKASPDELAHSVISHDRLVEGDKVAVLTPVSVDSPQFLQDIGTRDELRGNQFDERLPCWRWLVRFSWSGPLEFGYWPDEFGGDLQTFDNHKQLGFPPTLKWRINAGELTAACYVPDILGQADHPEELYHQVIVHLQTYIRAFDAQISTWHCRLMEELVRRIREKQALVGAGRVQRDLISERFKDWRVGPLHQEVQTVHRPEDSSRSARGQDARRSVVASLPALPEASIVEITKVVNRWVDAVEKYPIAFIELQEERLSDLLVATLNGAFARAEREVFIGSGKSDFYVTSNSVGADGNAEIFVGEVKIWNGPQRLNDAITQTLANLTRRTLSALLLVIVKNRSSFSNAVEEGRATIEADGRVVEPASRIATRASYWLTSALDRDLRVRLCVVWADLTKDRTSSPQPKGSPSRRPA